MVGTSLCIWMTRSTRVSRKSDELPYDKKVWKLSARHGPVYAQLALGQSCLRRLSCEKS